MEIRGKTALVTGGARRVGRAIVDALADAGARVAINYNSSAEEAEQAVREIRARGGTVSAYRADVSRLADIATLISAVERDFGGLDILVNSAARFDSAPIAEITEADWDRVMGVNLKGPFFLSQAAAPLLRRGPGVIINIADLSALQPWPSYAHHSVSKAGLLHLTRILARALAPVRANCIAPGTVLLPEGWDGPNARGAKGVSNPATGEADERTVLGRVGSPEDVARAVLYLAGSDFVTGEVLVVDGGRMLL